MSSRRKLLLPLLVTLSLVAVPADSPAAAEKKKKDKKKDEKAQEWVVAPIPVVEPNFGNGLAALALIFTPLSKKDTVSDKSVFGAGGFYTDTGTWGAVAGTRMFLSENRFRIDAGAGYFNMNYDFFGIGNEAGDQGRSIPIEQKGPGFVLGFLTRVKGPWYLGPRYRAFRIDTKVDLTGILPGLPPVPPVTPFLGLQKETTSAYLGLQLELNTKNYEFNPTTGTLFDLNADAYDEAVGSDFEFQKYNGAYNHYLRLNENDRRVIAVRGTACAIGGSAPFFELCAVGSRDSFRGYTTGRYRDEVAISAQAEYRWQFLKRFGMVMFGGLAQVGPSIGDFNVENLLPATGIGFRWMAAVESRINLRVDYAVGIDDSALYIFVGEAF